MRRSLTCLLLFLVLPCAALAAPEPGSAAAHVDLNSSSGAALTSSKWRYSDARIVETAFTAADESGQPSTDPVQTYEILPRAGSKSFDDSDWQVVAADSLTKRRGNGRVSFNWYRTTITIPEHVGNFATRGSTAVLEISLDDYAEIWVNGELPRAFGQSGGSVIAGWNSPNRLIVGRNVKPGQQISIAIFGINGPISNAPSNYIFIRTARLEFHAGSEAPLAVTPQEVNIVVERKDSAIDSIVPRNAKLFKLAEGFQFIEGPVWVRDGGYLLFSDPNHNTIYKYTEPGDLSVFRDKSGYSGTDIDRYSQPGSNGLALDGHGRLTIAEHGNRRISRLDRNGKLSVVAAAYRQKRLNSPNDLVYRSDGVLYFTDPPFGLPEFYEDPAKELPFSGIYSVVNGELRLENRDLIGPNGLAFSPDEKYLYVDNWDPAKKVVMRYPVRRDGRLGSGEKFFNMNGAPGKEALDGLKVDEHGNLFVSGPGGVWIISPDGRHLGTIVAPNLPANFAWGGADGRSLYLTARGVLYRMPLLVTGSTTMSEGS